MKEFFKHGIMAFVDRVSVRVYEIVILVLAGMCAGVGFTFTFVYYVNEIMMRLGLPLVNPFIVVAEADNDIKIRAVVMGIVGLIISATLLYIITGRKRIINN
jgi:hypothetical protein